MNIDQKFSHDSAPLKPLSPAAYLPEETQQLNLIFCPHGSRQDVEFARSEVAKLLRPEIKDEVRVVFWHECVAPVNFPKTPLDLKSLALYLSRKEGTLTPRVNWEQEFANGKLSKAGKIAFEVLHRALAKRSPGDYEKAFTGDMQGVQLKYENQAEWLILLASLYKFKDDGWQVEHKFEPTSPSVTFQIMLSDHYREKVKEHLLAGDTEKAMWAEALRTYNFYKSASQRDSALANVLAADFRPGNNVINICIRGIGHANYLTPMLAESSTPYKSALLESQTFEHQLLSFEDWDAVFKAKKLPPDLIPFLCRQLFLRAADGMFNETNGYKDNEYKDVEAISYELDPQKFVDYIDSHKGQPKTTFEFLTGAAVWFGSLEEVKSHHRWLPVYESMIRTGLFS